MYYTIRRTSSRILKSSALDGATNNDGNKFLLFSSQDRVIEKWIGCYVFDVSSVSFPVAVERSFDLRTTASQLRCCDDVLRVVVSRLIYSRSPARSSFVLLWFLVCSVVRFNISLRKYLYKNEVVAQTFSKHCQNVGLLFPVQPFATVHKKVHRFW